MNNPLVSIIIPTYNRAHLIGETLDSVLAQTYENWECIIVDDGSTDNSAEVIGDYVRKDSRFQYHKRPESHKPGGNGARNYGFEVCKGEYINWFDDDDIMLTEFLIVKVNLFNPVIKYVITTKYNVDFDLSKLEKIELYQPEVLFKDYVLWKFKIVTNDIMFRSEFFRGLNLFNEKISRGQETEFFSRLFFQATPKEYIIYNVPLLLYRQHKESKTQQSYIYVNHFKSSQTLIAIENLKRSIKIKDKELVVYYCKTIMSFFFNSINNNHKENSRYILKEFVPLLSIYFMKIAILFKAIGSVFYFINRSSYRIENYLKSQIKL